MSKLIARYKPTSLDQAVKGELVGLRHGDGRYEYGILLKKAGGQAFLAVIRSVDDQSVAHRTIWSLGNQCISYGSDWVFLTQDTPATGGYLGSAGTAIVGPEGRISLRLASDPSNSEISGATIDLATFDQTTQDGYGVVASGWSLWLREEDRQRPGAKPFAAMQLSGQLR